MSMIEDFKRRYGPKIEPKTVTMETPVPEKELAQPVKDIPVQNEEPKNEEVKQEPEPDQNQEVQEMSYEQYLLMQIEEIQSAIAVLNQNQILLINEILALKQSRKQKGKQKYDKKHKEE